MATAELSFLHSQLEERKRRLEMVITQTPEDANLEALLREVDSALDRFEAGTYGMCETCHDTVERDRLLADPLIRYCLDHLTVLERATLQRDLDLASELQRGLLPPADLKVDGWETSYHYAPLGPVSGDYCDLYPYNGQLFFMLGDVSGKGVAASMRMTQLHALFRSLIAWICRSKRLLTTSTASSRAAGWPDNTRHWCAGVPKQAAMWRFSTPATCP